MNDDYPKHIEFRFGDVFPADDPVAQFMVSVARAGDDATFLHDLWFGDSPAHTDRFTHEQQVWFMRQAMSQLWEVRKFWRNAEKNEHVGAWLDQLDGEIAEHLAALRGVIEQLDPGQPLRKLFEDNRNYNWHYQPPGALTQPMEALADTTQRITMTGPALKDTRASFADEVMFKIVFKEMKTAEFQSLVRDTLRPGVQAVMNFGVRAYGRYVAERQT